MPEITASKINNKRGGFEDTFGIYFHIPFCSKKCPYCHFYVLPNNPQFHSKLSEGLEKEWSLRKGQMGNLKAESIYFGGGTPTLFSPAEIEKLLKRASNRTLNCEITIEANPEEVTEKMLASYRSLGINRLSLGVQSLDDRSLQTLQRIHNASKAKEAISIAHRVGFDNISIDLMYDLPNQTKASWLYTLDQIENLPIKHLSLYNLTIEPKTPFHRRKEELIPLLPSTDLSLQLLEIAIERFEKLGLRRYEISAFAKEGYESNHNTGYWKGRPFLGFGPSAFSDWDGSRFRNIPHLNRYVELLNGDQFPIDFEETLPYPANVKERAAIELRLLKGIDLRKWQLPEETLLELKKLEGLGLVERDLQRYRLTSRGLLLYDSIAAEIV